MYVCVGQIQQTYRFIADNDGWTAHQAACIFIALFTDLDVLIRALYAPLS